MKSIHFRGAESIGVRYCAAPRDTDITAAASCSLIAGLATTQTNRHFDNIFINPPDLLLSRIIVLFEGLTAEPASSILI